ncbi:Bcr/CflA family drug resistance efflux transporter [Snodgrassella alvi]|uniref:multidrug effflux MFS transporter n=1 Tax=Snodgrassella alvi TaxID=1196083 RepID=UPI000CBE4E22|nr:multidrug effflux MFS transporter [Snodgrassella alvi]PIT11699.1 Bcr/CflA family drug resistance efflux transporter [Snodgrassella alvi]PIT57920.1 Bcr/CflA family drug resistance efflux transporter [Snodgrassella alvi]
MKVSPNQLLINPHHLALLLAVMVAIMPFSTDIYLSSVPEMATSLHAPIYQIERSLSSFMFGVALGQLLGGAISDIKGRKVMAMIGLSVYLLSAIAIVFIDSAGELLFWRWIQAMGGGMATVTVGATVRDFFQGNEAAKMFATIGIITLAAPLAAPMLGTALAALNGWRIIFIFLVVYALIVLVCVWRFMPQVKMDFQPLDSRVFHKIKQNFSVVFHEREALGFMFFQTAAFAAMFVFLTESSFVYMNTYGLSPHQYSWAFGANIITMMLFNRITAYRLRTTPARNILLSGVFLQLGCNLLLTIIAWSMERPPFFMLLALIMFSIGSQGLIGSNTQACFMSYFRKIGGSANAVLGTMQFLVAALVGWLTTLLHNGSIHVMPTMMLISTSCGAILLWTLSRTAWEKKHK